MTALREVAAVVIALTWIAASAANAQPATADNIHLGVDTCRGSNCHGAGERPTGSAVASNEYIVWSKHDKHRRAYAVLLEERAIRMAQAIGLPDAANQKLCLGCHVDNVAAARRGRQFQLDDGIGCEACHGGAANWLGVHISGSSHRDNLAAGLYPLEQPIARAEKCLGCHIGDETRFVDHRLLGAGHPRLTFELATYTATQPAHFTADAGYVERKGRINDVQVWAAGQAATAVKQMNALLTQQRAARAIFPDFALYDCQSCHHPYDARRAPLPRAAGTAPGTVRFNDANIVMLQAIAAFAAPAAARKLNEHLAGLRRTLAGDGSAIQRESEAIREVAKTLMPLLTSREFGSAEIRALGHAVIALGLAPDAWRFSQAEQVSMALQAVLAALRSSGHLGAPQREIVSKAIRELHASFVTEASFRPEAFASALREIQRAIGP